MSNGKAPASVVEDIRAELAKSVERLTTHPDENRATGAYLALQFILGADLERFKDDPNILLTIETAAATITIG